MSAEKILILFDRSDESWHRRLQAQLGALKLRFPFEVISGSPESSVVDLLADAWVVVLIVSKSFLNVKTPELQKRIQQRQARGRPAYRIQVNDQKAAMLKDLPSWPLEGSLDQLAESRAEAILSDLADTIASNFQPQGQLRKLHLENLGPSADLLLEPGARFNLVTGDNGLGKSFLLECAW